MTSLLRIDDVTTSFVVAGNNAESLRGGKCAARVVADEASQRETVRRFPQQGARVSRSQTQQAHLLHQQRPPDVSAQRSRAEALSNVNTVLEPIHPISHVTNTLRDKTLRFVQRLKGRTS